MIINKYCVDDRLIRGSRPMTFSDVKSLKKEGVTQIVCLETKPYLLEQLACKVFGIKFTRHKYDLLGGKYMTMDDFVKVADNIKNNNGKTYIHCSRGLHRTGICVAAYNMLTKGKNIAQVLKEDLIDKDYFEKQYAPKNNVIKKGDGLLTKIIKRRQNKIGKAIQNGFWSFVKTFRP